MTRNSGVAENHQSLLRKANNRCRGLGKRHRGQLYGDAQHCAKFRVGACGFLEKQTTQVISDLPVWILAPGEYAGLNDAGVDALRYVLSDQLVVSRCLMIDR